MGDTSVSQTGYISHFRSTTNIQDSVHGLIKLSSFEREIVDSPQFQRLHHVLQNSVNYTSFPTNKTSRFIHSLGCAHLAGRMFISGVTKSQPENLKLFLRACGKFINTTRAESASSLKSLKEGWNQSIRGQSGFQHKPWFKDDTSVFKADSDIEIEAKSDDLEAINMPALFIIETIWQAVRICGLVHDIGHLPMSHSFEKGLEMALDIETREEEHGNLKELMAKLATSSAILKDTGQGDGLRTRLRKTVLDFFGINKSEFSRFLQGIEIHELRTLDYFGLIALEGKYEKEYTPEIKSYRESIYRMSFAILCASAREKSPDSEMPSFSIATSIGSIEDRFLISSAFNALKALISGHVEADRMDYTFRDGKACASEIGGFDIDRVVDASILTMIPVKVLNDKGEEIEVQDFLFGFHKEALGALEQFFVERRDGYKHLIFHRTCSRSELCMRELIANLYVLALRYPSSDLAETLSRHGFLTLGDESVKSFFGDLRTSSSFFDDVALWACFRSLHISLVEGKRHLLGKESNKDKDSKSRLEICLLLIEMLLTREFRHIFDPLKYDPAATRIRRICQEEDELPQASDKDVRRIQKKIFNVSDSEELKRGFTAELSECCKQPFLVIWTPIPPKLYKQHHPANAGSIVSFENHEPAMKRLWLVNNRGIPFEIEKVSNLLRNMWRTADSERQFRIYVVAKDVKFSELKECIDCATNNSVKELCDLYYKDYKEN